MRVLCLPTELWANVASYLEREDHLSLVHVCRDFHNIFYGSLYSNLLIGPSHPAYWEESQYVESSIFAQLGPETSSLLKRLETDEDLRSRVRTIEIKYLLKQTTYRWEEDPNEPLYDAFVGAIIRICRDCPLLQRVTLSYALIQAKWVIYLASHPRQHLDLYLEGTQLYGRPESMMETVEDNNPEIGPSITVRSLTASYTASAAPLWIEIISRLLSSTSLKRLGLSSTPSFGLLSALNKHRQATSNLESLTVSVLDPCVVDLFVRLPNLRELYVIQTVAFRLLAPSDIPPAHGPTSALTKLEAISIDARLIPAFTSGRNITSIRARDMIPARSNGFAPLTPVNAGTFGRQFGSEVMVRTLEWEKCSRIDEVLDYLLEMNPGIWHLTIIPANEPSQEEFTAYLAKFSQLPELRTLEFPVLIHVPSPSTMAWEMEKCQSLRKDGLKSLVSVSFSAFLTWTRHPEDEVIWRPSGPGTETVKPTYNLIIGPLPFIYREEDKFVESPIFASAASQTSYLLERLEADADLRNRVRTIEIKHLFKETTTYPYQWKEDPTEPLYDAFVGAIIRICRDCPLLQRVTLTHGLIQAKWIIYLASHPDQHLDLHFERTQLYGSPESMMETIEHNIPEVEHGITVRSLTVPDAASTAPLWSETISWLLSSTSLKRLNLSSMSGFGLLGALNKHGEAAISNLESLTVSFLDSRAVDLFARLPDLRELYTIQTRDFQLLVPSDLPLAHGPTSALTKLEAISIDASNGFAPLTPINAQTFGRQFGSEVMVRTLEWEKCSRTDEILDYLLEMNPGIWHLTIVPANQPSPEELMAYLSKFSQLPELRTLKFLALFRAPSPRSIAWEMERCQELRINGAKSLVSVSFSTFFTWTRHPEDEGLWQPSGPGVEVLKQI
ncbi:hypothetical protein M408DRAFT_308028 [Serendipita vermifera MAFF 305830]|uniref:F-box domain-containing protein n=1 Tax=Serendipita vermifera MAFF 305830 TaxID=933852 RepID=A0A0C3AVT8_SERVB|nr:hypothetical protein M408DRAFT_308028 [Serendipita vermifera MAFF 305830]